MRERETFHIQKQASLLGIDCKFSCYECNTECNDSEGDSLMASPEPSSKPMLHHALEYLSLGYPVFPICSPLMGQHRHYADGRYQDCTPDKRGKTPMIRWKQFQTELPLAEDVREWWTRWPTANIGMATGALSGVIVLDCDSGEARQLALAEGGLEKAPAVWTGTPGGIHFWMQHPGYEVRNFVKDIPGTDFRGDGGYVLLPPSVHRNQNTQYRWNEHTVGRKPPPVPAWLEARFQAKASATAAGGASGDPLDVESMLAGFGEGERDTGLFKLACRFRHDDQPQAYAEALIQVAAQNCRPPFDRQAAVEKVRRAYKEYEPGGASPMVEADEFFSPPTGGTAYGLDDTPELVADEGWKVYDAADFLNIEYPTVAWRVQGFLRERAIMFNFGAPGSIKTYIATDAAIAVATGEAFLSNYPCEQGRVLIVQEDTLDSDFQQAYLGPLVRARGIDPERLRGQLFIAPPGGMSLGVPERIVELCAWLDEYKPDLLILDAFYLMHDGEGYGKDLGPIMKRLKAIRGKYGCAIWVIDHDRKGKSDGAGSENPIDRLWGGRQKSAAVDAIMESRPVKGTHGETFLDVIKLRGAKPAEPIRVKLHPDYRLVVEDEGEEKESSPVGTRNTVYEWLCREGGSRTKAQMSTGVNLSLRSIEGSLYELHATDWQRKSGRWDEQRRGLRYAEGMQNPSSMARKSTGKRTNNANPATPHEPRTNSACGVGEPRKRTPHAPPYGEVGGACGDSVRGSGFP